MTDVQPRQLGLVLRLCLALERRDAVREIAFGLAEAGELLLNILGSSSFAGHPCGGLGFDRAEPLLELLHTGPNRTQIGFAGRIELIDAARQRAQSRIDRIGIGDRRCGALFYSGQSRVELVDTALQCAHRRLGGVGSRVGCNGPRLHCHPRGERASVRSERARSRDVRARDRGPDRRRAHRQLLAGKTRGKASVFERIS